jgi:acylphosphatase
VARRVVVRGRVQGVFFRESTRRRAEAAGVAGWVRNRPDGAVEAWFEGPLDGVSRLVEYVRSGPRGASVASVEVVDESPSGRVGFRVG